jgi:hypothetical protein
MVHSIELSPLRNEGVARGMLTCVVSHVRSVGQLPRGASEKVKDFNAVYESRISGYGSQKFLFVASAPKTHFPQRGSIKISCFP